MAFSGFDRDIRRFFVEIGANRHSAAWFEENRSRYQSIVRDPMRELSNELSETALSIDDRFETRPTKTVARIRRDTRFSRDKSLYRDHLWLSFKHGDKRLSEGICLYFECSADSVGWGMGFWQAAPSEALAIRTAILQKPKAFGRLIASKKLNSVYSLEGSEYKRLPKGCEDAPSALEPWLIKKSISLCHSEPYGDDAFDGTIAERISSDLLLLEPLYRFISDAVEKK